MITKLLVSCVAVATLSIATERFNPFDVIPIDPRYFLPVHQNNQCQQYMSYYDNFYKQAYRKYFNNYYYNIYKQQCQHISPPNSIPNIHFGGENTEWVCQNSKTKDTIIVGLKHPLPNFPEHHPPPHYPQHPPPNHQPPNFPEHRPPPYYPQLHPPPNHPQQHPLPNHPQHHPPPNHPQHPPPPNNNPQHNPHGSDNQYPQKPQKPQTEKPNTTGEGIIDIRVGQKNNSVVSQAYAHSFVST